MKKLFCLFIACLCFSCFDIIQIIDGNKDHIDLQYYIKIPKTIQNILKVDIQRSENYTTFIKDNFLYTTKLQKSSRIFRLTGIPNLNYYEYLLNISTENDELSDAGYINKRDSFFPNVSKNYITIPMFFPENFEEKYIERDAYFNFLVKMANYTVYVTKRRMPTIKKISFVGTNFNDDLSYIDGNDRWIINVPLKKWFDSGKRAELVIQR